MLVPLACAVPRCPVEDDGIVSKRRTRTGGPAGRARRELLTRSLQVLPALSCLPLHHGHSVGLFSRRSPQYLRQVVTRAPLKSLEIARARRSLPAALQGGRLPRWCRGRSWTRGRRDAIRCKGVGYPAGVEAVVPGDD